MKKLILLLAIILFSCSKDEYCTCIKSVIIFEPYSFTNTEVPCGVKEFDWQEFKDSKQKIECYGN